MILKLFLKKYRWLKVQKYKPWLVSDWSIPFHKRIFWRNLKNIDGWKFRNIGLGYYQIGQFPFIKKIFWRYFLKNINGWKFRNIGLGHYQIGQFPFIKTYFEDISSKILTVES